MLIAGVGKRSPLAAGSVEFEKEFTYVGTPPAEMEGETILITSDHACGSWITGTIHFLTETGSAKAQISTDPRERIEDDDDVAWVDWQYGYITADRAFGFHRVTAIRVVMNDAGSIRLTLKS